MAYRPHLHRPLTGASAGSRSFPQECPHAPDHQHQPAVAERATQPQHLAGLALDLDPAPVVGPARQLVEGRCRRPGDRRPDERADPRHDGGDPQRQRRHLAGADRRRRAGDDDRRAAAHARAGGAGAERLQRHQRPRQPRHRVPAAVAGNHAHRGPDQVQRPGDRQPRRRRRPDLPGRRQQRRHADGHDRRRDDRRRRPDDPDQRLDRARPRSTPSSTSSPPTVPPTARR